MAADERSDMLESLLVLVVLALVVAMVVLQQSVSRSRADTARLQKTVGDLSVRVRELEKAPPEPDRAAVPEAPEPASPPAPVAPAAVPGVTAQATPAPDAAELATEPETEPEAEPKAEPDTVEPEPPSGVPLEADRPPPVAAVRGEPVVAGAVREDEPPAPRTDSPSLEAFLGGRVLLVVGVIVVLFGLAFLLKVAIERDLISREIRVVLGSLAGVAALIGGDLLRRRGFDVFGHALMGGGLAALYLCVGFSTVVYEFIGLTTGYALTAVLTIAGVALALWRDALLLAYLGLFGAYLAPALLGWPGEPLARLTGWLVVLDVGIVALLSRRRWYGLDLMAVLGTAAYFGWWHGVHMRDDRFAAAVTSAAVLAGATLLVALLPAVLSRRRVMPTSMGAALFAGLFTVVAGHALLYPDHRVALGAGVTALAAVYFACGAVLGRREGAGQVDAPLLHALGLAAIATALPLFARGHAVAPALAFGGLAAVFVGTRRQLPVFVGGGALMIFAGVIDLLAFRMPPHDGPFLPFGNGEFYAFAAPCLAFVVAGLLVLWRTPWKPVAAILVGTGLWLYAPLLAGELLAHFWEDRAKYGPASHGYGISSATAAIALYTMGIGFALRSRPVTALVLSSAPFCLASILGLVLIFSGHTGAFLPFGNAVFGAGLLLVAAPIVIGRPAHPTMRRVLLFVGLVYLLILITSEIVTYGQKATIGVLTREELRFRAMVWVSIAWAVYAAALLAAGFLRRRADLRWAGLVVFAITLVKVFLVDMAELEAVYRVGSFLVLGTLLVGVSFLYQRASRKADDLGDPTGTPSQP